MKAMMLHDPMAIEAAPLRCEEIVVPNPSPHELLIKVNCCGICRTDLHIIEGELPLVQRPIIPGHQTVGKVVKVGEDCRFFSIGDRVGVAWLRHTCGACQFCCSSRENLCVETRFTGYHEHGGYAEYAVVSEDFAYEIPVIFQDVEAAPLLCAGIIGFRALKRSQLQDGGRLGIFGFGSSAHLVLQLAKARNSDIYVISRNLNHQQLAVDLGANWVGSSITGIPEKLDSAIIFAPSGELVPDALSVLEKGGTLALAGIHMSEIPSLNYEHHLFYEKNIHSVTANTRLDGQEFLSEAASIPIKPHIKTYAKGRGKSGT